MENATPWSGSQSTPTRYCSSSGQVRKYRRSAPAMLLSSMGFTSGPRSCPAQNIFPVGGFHPLKPESACIGMCRAVELEMCAIVQAMGVRGNIADLTRADHRAQVAGPHQHTGLHRQVWAAVPQHSRIHILLHAQKSIRSPGTKPRIPGQPTGNTPVLEMHLDQFASRCLDLGPVCHLFPLDPPMPHLPRPAPVVLHMGHHKAAAVVFAGQHRASGHGVRDLAQHQHIAGGSGNLISGSNAHRVGIGGQQAIVAHGGSLGAVPAGVGVHSALPHVCAAGRVICAVIECHSLITAKHISRTPCTEAGVTGADTGQRRLSSPPASVPPDRQLSRYSFRCNHRCWRWPAPVYAPLRHSDTARPPPPWHSRHCAQHRPPVHHAAGGRVSAGRSKRLLPALQRATVPLSAPRRGRCPDSRHNQHTFDPLLNLTPSSIGIRLAAGLPCNRLFVRLGSGFAFGLCSGVGVRLCDGADVRIHGASLRPAFLAGASGGRSLGCRIRDKAYTFHLDQPPATGL
uniref:Uncharacterized protein n=1 Tax=Myoviridae sp. ctool15 TaxID=2826696 RepID=A0A8S5QYK3_9CAUD|nr:MAG TPA: hypothetical protein [Myoviridae sp. ctool15]